MKTYFFVFFFFLGFFTSGCKSTDHKIIDQLNDYTNADLTDSQKVDFNLKKAYALELENLQMEWQQDQNKHNLDLKNIFFSKRMNEKNQIELKVFENQSKNLIERNPISDNIKKDVLNKTKDYHFINAKQREEYMSQQEIGFCFLRALTTHHLLLQNDIPNLKIRKIFAVGPLLANHTVWKFHVATLVVDQKESIVIDPLFLTPLNVKKWMYEMEQRSAESPNSRLRFYITDPRKFLPDSGEYNLNDLFHPKIKKYSKDLLEYFRK